MCVYARVRGQCVCVGSVGVDGWCVSVHVCMYVGGWLCGWVYMCACM